MIGYYLKDQDKEHFQFCDRNVTTREMEENLEKYVKYSAPFLKKRTVLTHKNLIEFITTFCQYKMRKYLRYTLLGILLQMLTSSLVLFIICIDNASKIKRHGLQQSSFTWLCMLYHAYLQIDNITKIFLG